MMSLIALNADERKRQNAETSSETANIKLASAFVIWPAEHTIRRMAKHLRLKDLCFHHHAVNRERYPSLFARLPSS